MLRVRDLAAFVFVAGCARSSAESTGTAAAPSSAASAPAPAAQNDGASASASCVKDEDCVAAVCCHADRCVPRAQAPACGGIMCTHLCMPNTIDCGGGCQCQAGQCRARLMTNQ